MTRPGLFFVFPFLVFQSSSMGNEKSQSMATGGRGGKTVEVVSIPMSIAQESERVVVAVGYVPDRQVGFLLGFAWRQPADGNRQLSARLVPVHRFSEDHYGLGPVCQIRPMCRRSLGNPATSSKPQP